MVQLDLVRSFKMAPVREQSLDQFMAYLGTWSGHNAYVKKTGHTAVLDELRTQFLKHMPSASAPLRVTLPITVFVFRRPLAVASKL